GEGRVAVTDGAKMQKPGSQQPKYGEAPRLEDLGSRSEHRAERTPSLQLEICEHRPGRAVELRLEGQPPIQIPGKSRTEPGMKPDIVIEIRSAAKRRVFSAYFKPRVLFLGAGQRRQEQKEQSHQ